MSGISGWTAAQLGYCSNLHPCRNLDELRSSIRRFFQPVRQQRGLPHQESGLWIGASAAAELQRPEALESFLLLLRQSGLRLTSLNGFPYGNFHQERLKAEVYQPDWSEPARLQYSQQLATILATTMPEDSEQGVISTVPLGYAANWSPARQVKAEQQLLQLTAFLAELKQQTGKQIVFCLEMEADCVLEKTVQALVFFQHWRQLDPNHHHLALCFDVCHQAVVFENTYQSLTVLQQAGIPIGKIQLSNALVVQLDTLNLQRRTEVLDVLSGFVESTYLHQVKAKDKQGSIVGWADLPDALSQADQWLERYPELRVHFHVPLFSEQLLLPELRGSQQALLQTFDYLADHPEFRPVLEVETYSWTVLPDQLRPDTEAALIQGICAELHWVGQQLKQRQLLQGMPSDV